MAVTIIFEAADATWTVEAPENAMLGDVADEGHVPVPFSCRGGTCGSCAIEVVEGSKLLAPPGPAEQDWRKDQGRPDHRLTCQARIAATSGRIRLRIQNPGST
ncbi:MAG: 2Fe-2S iron-sulfur cluster-binding protein [Myxococcota bacterium]